VGPTESPDDAEGLDGSLDLRSVTRALRSAGCVAAEEEADELFRAARSERHLGSMLARRRSGEPLAWITGRAKFCGLDVLVDAGVYVPRWQSERLATLAASLLPLDGLGVDLCTGSGAVAMVMQTSRPDARVFATELDPVAAHCARRNGVLVYEGVLTQPLPADLAARVDVMTGVLPYVPTHALRLLPPDVQRFEPRAALDGGEGGLALLSEAVRGSGQWLRTGGWLLLETGSDQVGAVSTLFTAAGFDGVGVLVDDDSDPRGIYGQLNRLRADQSSGVGDSG